MGYEDEQNEKPVEDVLKEHEQNQQKEEIKQNQARTEYTDQKQYEDKQRQLIAQLTQAMGMTQIQEDLDALKQGMANHNEQIQNLALSIQKTVEMVDRHTQILQQGQTGQQTDTSQGPGGANLDQLQGLAEVIEKLGQVWHTVKGQNAPAQQPLIPQDLINQKMTQAFMDDLETGEKIRQYISDSLKKKATRTIVNNSLKGIGEYEAHSPE